MITVLDGLAYNKELGLFYKPDGKRADTPHSKGYRKISWKGKKYLAHRLVWYAEHGYFPNCQIDHINRIKDDNRIENLRLATNAQNHRNKSIQRNNTSGKAGVHWYASREKWMAYIKIDGDCKFLGYFDLFQDAVNARKEAEKELYGEFCPE